MKVCIEKYVKETNYDILVDLDATVFKNTHNGHNMKQTSSFQAAETHFCFNTNMITIFLICSSAE